MALQERKRVKVYELKDNDWYDRGTGFCQAYVPAPAVGAADTLDARIVVVSEEDVSRTLLETRITKDDGYQKQQETLIVWTEQNGVDMALSFQEAEGCASIWDFVAETQQKLAQFATDDNLSDDLLEPHSVTLPDPELGRLEEVDEAIRAAATTPASRDALVKFLLSHEPYILKLAPLVTRAEEMQSLPDLHKLCGIMKNLILLNDSAVIEFAVTDQAIMGVMGALEYDPDFPSHRANHRQYLSDSSKFKEVVPIADVNIRRKIHITYRLLYLKDVVLARILDDPTFSVLNSIIFYHQVDIATRLQAEKDFLRQLFEIFDESRGESAIRKKEAVQFIQNLCAMSKNLPVQTRNELYQNLVAHGVFNVIPFALRHQEASVRVAGTDVLVALIDQDPHMVRNHIVQALNDKTPPLTDTLIDLLLMEVDLGVKSQMADAIKILLDTGSANVMDMMARQANSELLAKRNGMGPAGQNQISPQTEQFINSFYEGGSARRLFQPLKDLEHRPSMQNLTLHETSLYTHLVEVLCFFVRAHNYRSKLFILSENLHSRIAQLLTCPQKHMKVAALKWFRTCISLADEFHNRQMVQNRLFEPILDIVYQTMPRDNLLNSACLELFEHIKRESHKQLIVHLVEQYRERLMAITYVNTFQAIVHKYDQWQAGYPASQNGAEDSSFTTQEGTPHRTFNGRQPFAGLKEMDHDEEAYFNADDDAEDDEEGGLPTAANGIPNGASPVRPLVSYPDDDEESMEILASSPDREALLAKEKNSSSSSGPPSTETDGDMMDAEYTSVTTSPEVRERGRNRTPVPVEGSPGQQQHHSPPESIASKRRREDEDDDELGKMMGGIKRRNSTASLSSQTGRLQVNVPKNSLSNHGVAVDNAELQEHNPRQQKKHQPQQSGQHEQQDENSLPPTHVPTLRRKGSLKTKNETQGGAVGKFSIKPISLGNVRHQGEAESENHDPSGGRGQNG